MEADLSQLRAEVEEISGSVENLQKILQGIASLTKFNFSQFQQADTVPPSPEAAVNSLSSDIILLVPVDNALLSRNQNQGVNAATKLPKLHKPKIKITSKKKKKKLQEKETEGANSHDATNANATIIPTGAIEAPLPYKRPPPSQKKRKKWRFKGKCPHCTLSFPSFSSFLLHLPTHQGPRRFPCHSCRYVALQDRVLVQHQKNLHPGSPIHPFQCPTRPEVFRNRERLQKHTEEIHFHCYFCEKTFPRQRAHHVLLHMHTHTGEKWEKCPHCPYAGRRSSDVTYHVERKHPQHSLKEVKFRCPKCPMGFAYISHYKEHMRQHERQEGNFYVPCPLKNRFLCGMENCQRDFAYEVDYHSHLEKHEKAGRIAAYQRMSLEEKEKSVLYKAREETENQEVMNLDYFDLSGNSLDDLPLHSETIEVEVDTDPPQPEEGGGRSKGYKGVECPYNCPNLFLKSEGELEEHLESHWALRLWYKCPLCQGSFAGDLDYLSHWAQKHEMEEEVIFGCEDCPKTFLLERYFALHVKKEHQGKIQPRKIKCTRENKTRILKLRAALKKKKDKRNPAF